jgi:hypothetical protein
MSAFYCERSDSIPAVQAGFLVEKLAKGRFFFVYFSHLQDIGIDGRLTLRCILTY